MRKRVIKRERGRLSRRVGMQNRASHETGGIKGKRGNRETTRGGILYRATTLSTVLIDSFASEYVYK